MTKKEMFNHIATINANNADIVAFCEKEIALLEKKRSSVNSKAKAEAEARAEKVFNALAEMDKPVTITELKHLTSDAEVADYNIQRISALLRNLGEEKISKEYVKGVAYFSVR